MIRTLIVDDEAPARRRLRQVLDDESGVEVVGECRDGPEAIVAIRDESPDVVFLDVRMPEMNGFEVLRAVGVDAVPVVVFVTAYGEYAVDAFEARALDYLLKPFSRSRFEETMSRVRETLSADAVRRRLARELRALVDDEIRERRLVIRTPDRVVFLDEREIDRIEGAGNYIRIHVGDRSYLYRETLKGILARLEPGRFLRVHRSHIVRVDRIREMRRASHGEFELLPANGNKVPATRTYAPELRRRFEL
ncbi:MAG: LytR/AlgR family response regulator transcription factor [Gemmatimonadota bacterium]